jgi:hypothetical protein
MLRTTIAILAAAAGGLSAQATNATAHVQETLLGYLGNSVPFGCTTTGLFVEARSQILIPAPYLPGPGARLTGIAVQSLTAAGGSGSLSYPFLGISVSPLRASAALRPTFADNLPTPAVLLNASNLSIAWTAGAWTTIPFGATYTHDGASDLVIDIQKIVSPSLDLSSRTTQNSGRTDLPPMINAFGPSGSNAHRAAVATVTTNHAPSLLLLWSAGPGPEVPTLRLLGDPATNFARPFALGRDLVHTVEATPGAAVVHLAAPGLSRRVFAMPPFIGRGFLSDPFAIGTAIVPAGGEVSMRFTIPNQPALVGVYLAFQSLAADSAAGPWRFTNVADLFVNG